MSLFKRERASLQRERTDKVPEFINSSCLGESCPNFTGQPCETSEMEWLSAKATVTKDRDTSKPPRRDEAIYVTYGQRCNNGDAPELVAQEVHVMRPDLVSTMALVAMSDRHADTLMTIRDVNSGNVNHITTLMSSRD